MTRPHAYVLSGVLAFAFPAFAGAATRYVADTGNDGADCGLALTTACRSITQAIALAAPGDTILVGPGRYGDLNGNGALGEAGEELGYLTPPASCSCVLRIEKPVIVISSGGAAVTVIDGSSVDVIQNVLIFNGGEFGRPGKGFTVTQTRQRDSQGRYLGEGIVLVVDSDVTIRGNQVVFTLAATGASLGTGIVTLTNAAVRIEGNLVMGWYIGISARGAATVSRNQITGNVFGIRASGGTIVGNVVGANLRGIEVAGTTTVVNNAVYMNTDVGIFASYGFSGVVTKNNIFSNFYGLHNDGTDGLVATNNYWGAPSGPGRDPADEPFPVSVRTDVTPFATKPFTVKVLKP